MEPLHDRIKRLRLAAGYPSHKALADVIGVSWQTVQQWENGGTGPARGRQQKVADALKVSKDELMFGTPSRRANVSHIHVVESMPAFDGNTRRESDRVHTVPLISWVQAGMWSDLSDELQPGEGDLIETTYKARAHTFALRVKGDSMEPRFPDGSILIVEPDEDAVPGKFVVVRQNGHTEATFKQLVQDGGTLFLKPLNAQYPIMELSHDAVICGVVKRVEMDV